jgi:hypothetical protein
MLARWINVIGCSGGLRLSPSVIQSQLGLLCPRPPEMTKVSVEKEAGWTPEVEDTV